MCSLAGRKYGQKVVKKEEIRSKKVLEVGSKNFNGSWRPFIEKLQPKQYIGVDIQPGDDVDFVCDGTQILEKFGPNSFDVIIATEVFEHLRDWKLVVTNIKKVLKPNGFLFITTRSKGYWYHAYPYDFWRYEVSDMKAIFSDMKIINCISDPDNPGVFVKVQKPSKFKQKNLDKYELYSIIRKQRCNNVNVLDILYARVYYGSRRLIWSCTPSIVKKFIIQIRNSYNL